MDPKLTEKLKKLKDYWYNDDYSLKWVEDTEKAIHRIVAAEKLAENKAVVPIIADANNRISAINKLLIYDTEMTIDVRKMLIRERDVHQFWLDRFSGGNIEARLAVVENLIDEELSKVSPTPA